VSKGPISVKVWPYNIGKSIVLDGSSQITESTALATQIHVLLQSFCVLLIHRTKGWFKSLRQGVKGPNISIALAITLES
jgi:hypothetical protein